MTPKNGGAWLKNWLSKHPPRMPAAAPDSRFTEEVMSRIRAEQAPAPVVWRWIPKPRLGFALGGALAAVLTLVLWIQRPAGPLLKEIEQDSNSLLEAGELWTWSPANPEDDWQELDRIVLAQAIQEKTSTPEEEEILQLWEELELRELPSSQEREPAEDLSDELIWLDQTEIAVS